MYIYMYIYTYIYIYIYTCVYILYIIIAYVEQMIHTFSWGGRVCVYSSSF